MENREIKLKEALGNFLNAIRFPLDQEAAPHEVIDLHVTVAMAKSAKDAFDGATKSGKQLAKVKFKFFFLDDSTMQTSHTGEGVTKDDAEAKAWQAMAADNFTRQLILKTTRIELDGEVEFS